MARRQKTPECKCTACARFNFDGPKMYANFVDYEECYPSPSSAKFLRAAKQVFVAGTGCDLCKTDGTRIAFVPQIIKDFLRVEYLCEWCRLEINRLQFQEQWPICWGSTSDDEIKWFLMEAVLKKFRQEVHRLSPAQIAKDKAFQAWLDTLPKEEEVPEIEIMLKRRVKPKVIDITLTD